MPLITNGSNEHSVARWFDSTACQRVLAVEQRAMIPLLTSHIGVRGLFVRASHASPAELSGNMLQHVCRLYPREFGLSGDLDCGADQVPLANESLNLVFIQHALEQLSAWPALIAEAARCLQPEGLLMITVFSRFSLWRTRWPRQSLRAVERQAVIRACEQGGLQIEERLAIGPLWPLPLTENLNTQTFNLGACHTSWALVARKRRPGMTPVGLRRNVVFNTNARTT